ncbi:MAG: Gfo/Idh/MocA family oxidoreductase [Polyangiaceae bacterium]|nr:Gfo/Idh/MocA family oxidoreductase [Polyangiaceae bacterium]
MIRVAIVGAGRWGINHVRAFARLPEVTIAAVCDIHPNALLRARTFAPSARSVHTLEEVLAAPDIDAVVLATPARTHAPMAEAVLRAGKHLLVEKPLALTVADAERVVQIAADVERILMVGHLMLYHPVVHHMRRVIESGELGTIHYLYALRVNLGIVRRDENAMWSLAPHDLSTILHLTGDIPKSVTARGGAYLQPDVADVVFLNLRFQSGVVAQIQTSWLDPRKERRLTVVGSKKMMEMNDVSPRSKLQIFDKGVVPPALDFSEYAEFLTLRNGEVTSPEIVMEEPLSVECRHFIHCIHHNEVPLTSGAAAVPVIRILEAAQTSLERDGVPIAIQ